MLMPLTLIVLAATPAQTTTVPSEANSVVANTPADAAPVDGLWPSPKLLNLMLQRWAEEACEEYDLDGDQRAKVREATVKRFESFLTENRSRIQPLANEFIEMRMDLEPPSKERVQAWADRALPVFEKSRDQIRESNDEFRKVLRPMQRAKFEVDALQMSAGMAIAEHKLKGWKEGEFDKDVFWEPSPAGRRQRREESRNRRTEHEQSAETASPKMPVDQVVAELDRWEKYVADFVQMFNLDEGQRIAALSCLSELKDRAVAHRDRRREDIARLEYRIERKTVTDVPLDDLKKQLSELYGPIDDMFKELQTRLDQIPTALQREAVRASQEPTGGETAPAPKR
jgi:hypothetical protein